MKDEIKFQKYITTYEKYQISEMWVSMYSRNLMKLTKPRYEVYILRIKVGTSRCTTDPKVQTSLDVHLISHYLPLLKK